MFRTFLLCATLLIPTLTVAQQGDPLTSFSENNTAMNAAMSEAQSTLPAFLDKTTDNEGYSVGNVSIKVAFDTAMGTEIIWVGPFAWDGQDRMIGLLRNQPNFMDGFNVGDRVDFDTSMVRDWSVVADDGTMFGNYTTRVMIPELDAATAQRLLQMLSPDPVPQDW